MIEHYDGKLGTFDDDTEMLKVVEDDGLYIMSVFLAK